MRRTASWLNPLDLPAPVPSRFRRKRGYLGGAVATHVRVGSPLLTHALFPVYVAALVWGGLYLREDRLRALLPLRR